MKKILILLALISSINLAFANNSKTSQPPESIIKKGANYKVNVDKITILSSEDVLKRNTKVQSFGNYTNDIIVTVIKNLNNLKSNNVIALNIELTPEEPHYDIASKQKISKDDTQVINNMMSELYHVSPVMTKETIKFQIFFVVDIKKPSQPIK